MDSLEVGVVEIGCKCAPNHCQCRCEALKRLSAMLAAFSCFGGLYLRRGWCFGAICSSQGTQCWWGALKGKILRVVKNHPQNLPLPAHFAPWFCRGGIGG